MKQAAPDAGADQTGRTGLASRIGPMGWAGIYIIIALALVRFLDYPLQKAFGDRAAALTDQQEVMRIKTGLLRRAELAASGNAAQEDERLRSASYRKEASITAIQTEVLSALLRAAEAKGLTVTGFEMPEAVPGKVITEVPAVLRLKGKARDFFGLLESIEEGEKSLAVRSVEIAAAGQEMNFVLAVRAFRVET